MSNNMDMFGDLSSGGRVLSRNELVEKRHRAGQCPTCGQRLFHKSLFKSKAITLPGKVLNGRCLNCLPQNPNTEELVAEVAAAPPAGRRRGGGGGAAARKSESRRLAGAAHAVMATQRHRPRPERSGPGGEEEAGGLERAPRRGEPRQRLAGAAHAVMVTQQHRPRQPFSQSLAPVPAHRPPDTRDRRPSAHDSSSDMGFDLSAYRAAAEEGRRDGTGRPRAHAQSQHAPPSRGLQEFQRASFARPAVAEGFLDRATPRPSALLLNGDELAELFKDYDSDDDDGGGMAAPPVSDAVGRLSPEERQALQSLHAADNSFADIVTIMMMNSTSAPVNDEGLHALSLLRDPDRELLEEVADSCGFEVIVSAMGMCGKVSMAQTNACKVLFIASAAGEEMQKAVGRAGGIEALADAMGEFSADVLVLEGCLLALGNLCVPEENQAYALGGPLIELTCQAMSDNVENCCLQEHACAVLANLAVHAEARRRVRECGGCDTIVVSMIVNPADVDVQCQAMVTLRNLCAQDEENKVVLANAGALDAVIHAMQNYRDDATAQGRGSRVLGIMGINEDNRIYVGENGGPDVIVRSMLVHEEDPVVQEMGCRALWTLSVAPRTRLAIVEVGAIPAVVAAMQNHVALPNIQERGCGVLANLAANNDELKIAIVTDGALDATVMAMVLHGENEQIQDRAVALLFKLCIPENIEAMVNANVGPMMAVVAEIFPDCQEKASYIMTKLHV